MSKRIVNPNFKQLICDYQDGKRGSVLYGSSRSGKTYSGVDFIVWLATHTPERFTLNIVRETYNSFKTTLYEDFNNRLPQYGIRSPFENVQEKPSFRLFGHKVNLLGADKISKFLGTGSDFLFFNEGNHIPKKIFDQLEMRCKLFWWMDFNPEHTKHWIYENIMKRDDVGVLKTTFLDNPFCPPNQKKKILSYEPTPENIRNGTADEWMWKVYGQGQIAPPRGVVFKYWKTYKDLPDTELYRVFAIDWGGNDPTTLIEVCFNKSEKEMYCKEIIFTPQILNSELIKIMNEVNPYNDEIVCDSARKDKIYELQMAGLNAFGSTKGEGSIIDGIEKMKEFKIFIHEDSQNLQNEFTQYKWVEDQNSDGFLNKPEDANNHGIDSIRYATRYYYKTFMHNYQ